MEGGPKTDQATSSVAPTSSSGTASSALGNQCDGKGREFSVLMRGVKRKFPGDFDVCHCCIKEAERLTHEVYRLGSFPVIINHCFLSFSKNPPAVDDALKQLWIFTWFVWSRPRNASAEAMRTLTWRIDYAAMGCLSSECQKMTLLIRFAERWKKWELTFASVWFHCDHLSTLHICMLFSAVQFEQVMRCGRSHCKEKELKQLLLSMQSKRVET